MGTFRSPFRSPFRPLTRAITEVGVGGGASFTPLEAFANGEQGAWYDESDLSTMFQDVAGTVPVTAAGQTVALHLDKSGNNNHRTQSTAGSRPSLQHDGTNYYLDWASSKWMSCANFNMSASDKATLVFAIRKIASASGMFLELSASGASNNGTFFYLARAAATTDQCFLRGSTSVTGTFVTGAEPVTVVPTVQLDLAGAVNRMEVSARVSGAEVTVTPSGTDTGGGSFGSGYTMYFGSRAGTLFYFNSRSYQTVIVGGAALLSTIQNLERYCGQKCGLTIAGPLSVPARPGGDAFDNLVSYGQSLALGTLSTPIQNGIARFDSVSFSGGVRPLDGTSDPAVAYATYIPLIERAAGSNSNAAYGSASVAETPVFGACAAIKELLASEGGDSGFYKLVGLSAGKGATSITALGRGSAVYDRMIGEIRYGRRLSAADGKPHNVRAVTWMQGEADPTLTTQYKAVLEEFYRRLVEDVKDSTGQSADPVLLCYQTPSQFAIGAQQYEASVAVSGIHIASPMYQLPKADAIAHLTGPGSEIMGAYFGKAYKRLLVDGSWMPLCPASYSYAGGDIDIVLQGNVGQVALDTTIVPSQTASGFSLLDAGASPVTINSVTVVGTNTIRLSTSATIAAGYTVQYATALAGGNVRDSDPTVYDPTGANYRLYNWLVAFQKVLT